MAEDIGKPQFTSERARRVAKRLLRHENAVLIIILLALIGVFSGLTKGRSVTLPNVTNVLLQASGRGVASVGQAFVILTGGIDLTPGGLALVAMIVAASMMTGTTAFPAGPIAIMFLVGVGVGSFNGLLVSRVGMPALIVTLAVWNALTGVAFLASRGYTIGNLPPAISFIGGGTVGLIPIPVIIFVAVLVVAYFVLYHTTFGRSIYAVGGNPASAWLSGVRIKNVQFSVYVISGFTASLAGLILLGRMGCASTAAGSGLELDSIAAVVIGGVSLMGGRGSLIGVIIGVMIMGIVNNGMNIIGVHPAFQSIVKGIIILLAVAIDYMRRRG
jgi:ribose/xylose/arabinose/galactoside ABC-type transport system permease subunit